MTNTTPTEIAAIHAAQVALAAPLSIKETVLAQILEAEPGVIALAKRYENVVYDTATPKGMREAVAARADLRDNGRMLLTKTEKRIKGDVNDLKRVMAPEFERLVAIIAPVEDAIDLQIKAEEKRRAEEKAERERIEQERLGAHAAGLAKLAAYAGQADGKPVDAIERAIAALQSMVFGAEWEEFAEQAAQARDASVQSMQRTLDAELQRIENARLAKELAAVQAQIAAIQAKEKADADARWQAAELARQKSDAADAAQRQADEAAAERAAQAIAQAAQPEPEPAPETQPEPEPELESELKPEPEPEDGALTLEGVNQYLAPVTLDAQALESFGFICTDGLYCASDLPALRIALIEHLSNIPDYKA